MSELHNRTPLLYSIPLSNHVNQTVYLKMETFQPSGSFKNRGMGELCAAYAREGFPGITCCSGGNAGLAAAYSARKLGLKAKIVVPTTSPEFIRDKMRAEGAEVIVKGSFWKDSHHAATEIAEKESFAYASPYNHPAIWTGNSTMIDEIAATSCKPDVVILSVGGGGLLCGVLEGLHRTGWKNIPVITSETEGAASFAASVYAGELVTLDKIDTVAHSLGVPRVAERAFQWTKEHLIFPEVVTDEEAMDACIRFAEDHRVLVEPACGAALALVYNNLPLLQDFSNIVVIVCGGNLVNLELMNEWKRILSHARQV